MIRVSVVYPKSEGSTFDWDYYTSKHMPLVREKMGSSLARDEVDQALPDSPHHAAVHLFFASPEALQAGMAAAGGEVMADIPNYTNTQPTIYLAQTSA